MSPQFRNVVSSVLLFVAGLIARILAFTPVLAAQVAAPPPPEVRPEAPPAAITPRQQQWLASTPEQRIRLAEALGEEWAQKLAEKLGYQPLLQPGDRALPQGLDQVYRTKDGYRVVIEAKGGTSPLGHAYGAEQGTPRWAVEAARRVASSAKASQAEIQAAREVLKAAAEGKLLVQVIRTEHVLGEPTRAFVESTRWVGKAERALAAGYLDDLARAAGNLDDLARAARAAGSAGAPPAAATESPATGETAATRNGSRVPPNLPMPKPATPKAPAAPKAPVVAPKAAPGAGRAASSAASTAGQGVLPSLSKAAGAAAVAADLGFRGYEVYETEQAYRRGEISSYERTTRHAENAVSTAGGWAGAWAGMKAGAAGGTAVGGPIGTVFGGIGGAIAGYFAGDWAGRKVVRALRD